MPYVYLRGLVATIAFVFIFFLTFFAVAAVFTAFTACTDFREVPAGQAFLDHRSGQKKIPLGGSFPLAVLKNCSTARRSRRSKSKDFASEMRKTVRSSDSSSKSLWICNAHSSILNNVSRFLADMEATHSSHRRHSGWVPHGERRFGLPSEHPDDSRGARRGKHGVFQDCCPASLHDGPHRAHRAEPSRGRRCPLRESDL